jgi:peptide/nickel transport system substrate-binding protein
VIEVRIWRLLGVVAVLFAIGACCWVGAQGPAQNVAVINGYPVIWTDPAVASDWYDTEVMYNLYSPLVYPTPEGSVRPHLATSWAPVGGDLTHWRFELRQGVKFHSGNEMTAEDVAWSMTRFITMGRGNSGPLGKVTATVVDKDTVDFVLDKPSAIFPETLALFFPVEKELVLANIKKPGSYGELGDYGEEWLGTHDAGTGPYMMVSHIPGQSLEAVRFPDYFEGWTNDGWGPDEVPIERLIFIMETDYTTLMTLLKSGDLDLEINGGWTLPQLQQIKADPKLRLEYVWAQNVTVWMNTKRPPTDDEHFRKAVLYAYDYEAVVGPWAEFGNGETGIILPTMAGYVRIEPQPRQQDLAKARAELALSKYATGPVPPVVFHYCAGLSFEEEIGLQLQADLAKLGLTVEVAGPPWPQYSAECSSPETTPNMTIFLFAPQVAPPHDYYTFNMYHPNGLGWIFEAHWFFEDPEIIRLLELTRATVDFSERLQIYQQLQPMIAAHALAFYPYQKPTPFATQCYISGPKEKTNMVGPSENMHNWRINLAKKAGGC